MVINDAEPITGGFGAKFYAYPLRIEIEAFWKKAHQEADKRGVMLDVRASTLKRDDEGNWFIFCPVEYEPA